MSEERPLTISVDHRVYGTTQAVEHEFETCSAAGDGEWPAGERTRMSVSTLFDGAPIIQIDGLGSRTVMDEPSGDSQRAFTALAPSRTIMPLEDATSWDTASVERAETPCR